MGVMDRFLNAMRLNSDEDDYYDDDFYDEDDEDIDDEEEDDYEPRRRSPFRGRRGRDDYFDDDEDEEEDDYVPARGGSGSVRNSASSQGNFSKVTQMRPTRRSSSGGSSMEVCVIKPISVDDARDVTEALISNRTVILNLEGLDIDIAQRIIDFTSGSCYAISGSLQKVSNYIFAVTPSNVDVSGDIQNIMSAFGSPTGIQSDI